MAHFVCPCLNVHIFCVKGHPQNQQQNQLDATLDLSALSLQDSFFDQHLSQVTLDKKGILTSQTCLVDSRTVDQWTIFTCLSCRKDTHATSTHTKHLLINSSTLLSDAAQIKMLLLSADYSQLYRLILPPAMDNHTSPNKEIGSALRNCELKALVRSVREQAENFLLQEQKQLEQTIRQYTENQFALYAALQNKIARERQILVELVTCAFQQHHGDKAIKMVTPIPFDHFPSPPTSPDNSRSGSTGDLTVNRQNSRLINQSKSVVGLSNRIPANQWKLKQRRGNSLPTTNGNHLSKSVEENAIFDMDGLESEETATVETSHYEEDTDESTSEDSQPAQNVIRHKYASSVPITVPFMTTYNHLNDSLEDPTPDDPNQIAASIQALALSIRDDKEMFGDLPRRRLNTADLVKSRPI